MKTKYLWKIVCTIFLAAFVCFGCDNVDLEESSRVVVDKPIKIALIDTGISPEAINSEHLLPGWNYCSDSSDTMDTIGHGTGLASLILGSEKAGVEGGAPEVYVVPLVCQMQKEDKTIQKIEPEGLAQIIKDAADVYDCDIISLCAGVKTDYPVLEEAVTYISKKGVLMISSAGNEGTSDIYYPGGYEDVLCVGSLNEDMTKRASFTQQNDRVDILAPGVNLTVATMKGNPIEVSGTSYSTAYITAVVGNMWQSQRSKTAAEIVEELMEEQLK